MSDNGRLPADERATIPGTAQQVRTDLLTQTAALRAAFAAHFGKPLGITDSYRPYEVQERIFRERYTTDYAASAKIDRRTWLGRSWWRRYRPGTRRTYDSAATPGTSNHGYGQAIDFASRVNVAGSDEHDWMVANAPTFGWYWPTAYRRAPYFEPWHFEAVPVPVARYSHLVPGVALPFPTGTLPDPLTPEDDMPLSDQDIERVGAVVFAKVQELLRADDHKNLPAVHRAIAEVPGRLLDEDVAPELAGAGQVRHLLRDNRLIVRRLEKAWRALVGLPADPNA